ncbi:MAG: TonB-dependent receptor, partial [Bacteroidota bacterium]|nr:TonB-dependent receptor [Bacteroidota bacterium]
MLSKKILTLFLAVCFTVTLMAQETTSEIQGVVSDGNNLVAGAVITATHNPTGTKYVTTSRKDGRYNLPNVKVGGPYTITVSFVGYKIEKQEGIILALGQEFKADFSLELTTNNLADVTVKAIRNDKVFNNNHTGSQEIISRTQIEQLPTINRSIQDFVKLEPTANGLNIGGRSSQYNNMTVDGANFNNSFGLAPVLGGQTNSQPISLEAIDQIQINISPYDVKQGGFSGTGINTVTKSGTNTFKATVYTYMKNQDYQGYNVGDVQLAKTNYNYSIKGFSLGGPLVKNKLFFYFSGEEVNQTAPSTSMIASDASHTPLANVVSQANADTLNALANFLKTKFNYDPGAFQGYSFVTKSDKITAKIDWNINSKNTFTIKYNYLKSSADQFASTSRFAGAAGGQPSTYAMPFFGSGYVINNNFNIIIAELNTRFGNKASNKIQAGYTALRDFRSSHSNSAFPLVDILNGGNIMTTFGYEPFTYNNTLNTDVYQFSDIFTMYKGAHEITIGTQDSYKKYQNAFAPYYEGGYQFNSLTDFYNSVNNGAANAKTYYLQYSALPGGAFPWAYAGSTELGFFAQDKWRMTKTFTLTYGLRADYTSYKQAFTDNPYFDALTFAGGAQYNIGQAPMNNLIVSPRIGFNWDVIGDRSLQIRGGMGVFTGAPPFVWISNQASNNGIQFGSFTKSNIPFNADVNANRPPANAPNSSYSTAMVASNFKYPTVLKSNLAMDKKLANGFILTMEASYFRDLNAVNYANVNLNESGAFSLAGADNRKRFSVAGNPKYYSGAGGATLANPNLGTAILMNNNSKGYGFTGTVKLQKNSRNFNGAIAYTYSTALNTAEFGSTASSLWSAVPVNTSDPNAANLGLGSYYQPHRIIASAAYKFSYGKIFTTTIGAIYEIAPNGVGSYVYNGDLNGDGIAYNDLIFIPKTASDINLVKVGSGGNGTGSSTDPRTPSQIWSQLDAFIQSSPYLRKHRGQ